MNIETGALVYPAICMEPDVVIKVKPDRTDLVNEQNVDGKDCIVIELNGEVVVNGINVRSDSEA